MLHTCGSTRVVYLDLVPNASSGSLIKSIARHGTPKRFFSNNTGRLIRPQVQDHIYHANVDWDYLHGGENFGSI